LLAVMMKMLLNRAQRVHRPKGGNPVEVTKKEKPNTSVGLFTFLKRCKFTFIGDGDPLEKQRRTGRYVVIHSID
jgi:hypothetical protein